jgi:hypothetical protein
MNFFNSIQEMLGRFFGKSRRDVIVVERPANGNGAGHTGTHQARPPFNPAAHAFQQIFTPTESAEDQVLYRTVGPDGMIVEHKEEWVQVDGILRTRQQKTLVVTRSGEVVTPMQIKAQCGVCGGYESELLRCATCGIALCKLHAPVFAPTGQSLCPQHHAQAVSSFNTWASRSAKVQTRSRL